MNTCMYVVIKWRENMMEVVHADGVNSTSGILGPSATTHYSTRSNEDTIAIKNTSEQNTVLFFVIFKISSQAINISFLPCNTYACQFSAIISRGDGGDWFNRSTQRRCTSSTVLDVTILYTPFCLHLEEGKDWKERTHNQWQKVRNFRWKESDIQWPGIYHFTAAPFDWIYSTKTALDSLITSTTVGCVICVKGDHSYHTSSLLACPVLSWPDYITSIVRLSLTVIIRNPRRANASRENLHPCEGNQSIMSCVREFSTFKIYLFLCNSMAQHTAASMNDWLHFKSLYHMSTIRLP